MATYTAVSTTEKDVDSPITVSLIDKLDQNPLAMFEGASGAPKLANAAISDNSITPTKLVKSTYDIANNIGGTSGVTSSNAYYYDYGDHIDLYYECHFSKHTGGTDSHGYSQSWYDPVYLLNLPGADETNGLIKPYLSHLTIFINNTIRSYPNYVISNDVVGTTLKIHAVSNGESSTPIWDHSTDNNKIFGNIKYKKA